MTVSNNYEVGNNNRPQLLFEEMHQNSIYRASGETLRVEDKYKYQNLYKIKARDLANKSVNLSTNYTA